MTELINTSTIGGDYLDNPDNLAVSTAGFNLATLSYQTFNVPTLTVTTNLSMPLVVTATNQASDILTFMFNRITATSSGNGSLDLYWSGALMGDSAAEFNVGTASLSAAFTASNSRAVGNASFSLAIPPESDPGVLPEPAGIAIIGMGLLALAAIGRVAR